MVVAVYLVRVPKKNVKDFFRINKEAGEIYQRYGAEDSRVFEATDTAAKYGCMGIADALPTRDDEVVYLGCDAFNDAAHQAEVMDRVDIDPRINERFAEIQNVIDLSRVIRGAFTTAD